MGSPAAPVAPPHDSRASIGPRNSGARVQAKPATTGPRGMVRIAWPSWTARAHPIPSGRMSNRAPPGGASPENRTQVPMHARPGGIHLDGDLIPRGSPGGKHHAAAPRHLLEVRLPFSRCRAALLAGDPGQGVQARLQGVHVGRFACRTAVSEGETEPGERRGLGDSNPQCAPRRESGAWSQVHDVAGYLHVTHVHRSSSLVIRRQTGRCSRRRWPPATTIHARGPRCPVPSPTGLAALPPSSRRCAGPARCSTRCRRAGWALPGHPFPWCPRKSRQPWRA